MLYEQKPLSFEGDDVLNKILVKSQDIIKLNSELSKKLKENENTVLGLSNEINILKKEFDKAKKSTHSLRILEHKIEYLSLMNQQLSKNIKLLKADLFERNSYINSLKRQIITKKNFLVILGEKDKQIELLRNNMKILKDDLIEKKNHINVLRRVTISKKLSNEKKSSENKVTVLKEELSKKDGNIKKLEDEKNLLKKRILEHIQKEERDKKKTDKETKLLFTVTNKLRHEMSKSSRLKGALTRNEVLEEENRKLSNLINNIKTELVEKKEEIKALVSQIEKNKSVTNKFRIMLKKLKEGLVFTNKENKELARRLKQSEKELEDIKKSFELERKRTKENKLRYEKEINAEKGYHREQMKKFIKQYFRVKMFSESEVRELKKSLHDKEKEKGILKSKIEFLKNEIAEQTKNELDLKSELEILKKEKNK